MDLRKLKILIVGYGSIGRRHRDVLSALYPEIDIDIVSRSAFGKEAVFSALDEVTDLDHYTYILLCSETVLHRKQFEAIERRTSGKTVLIEKPLFTEEFEPSVLRNKYFVGYNLRFHPVITALAEMIRGEKVLFAGVQTGQYLPSWRPSQDYRTSYSASRERGGGVLLDLSHELDYSGFLFGSIRRLKGIDRKISDLEIESDDLMTMIGMTERNVVINITVDYLSRIPLRRLVVQCEGATYFADIIANTLIESVDGGEPVTKTFGTLERNFTYAAMHRAVLEQNGRNVCTFDEACDTLRVIGKIRNSERTDWKNE